MQETEKATAGDIIAAVIDNLRENAEPLSKSYLAPGIFQIHLHQADYGRLRTIFARLQKELSEALDAEVESQNNRANAPPNPVKAMFTKLPEILKGVIGQDNLERPLPYEKPVNGWQFSFHTAADEDHKPGDILVISTLALPVAPGLSEENPTIVLGTRRRDGASQKIAERTPAAPPDVAATSYTTAVGARVSCEPRRAFAIIRYQDEGGPRIYEMMKNQIVIGRGGTGYWVDLRLETKLDVSREHLRLRRDEATGQFHIKDLSAFGCTINGQRVPRSVEEVDGRRVDRNVEAPLPARARIVLADVITLEFEAL
jgi:hypothetical protein